MKLRTVVSLGTVSTAQPGRGRIAASHKKRMVVSRKRKRVEDKTGKKQRSQLVAAAELELNSKCGRVWNRQKKEGH